ncbi:hypothetical protein [Pyxidicoccus sp. MSG2]|uniref:hypothetical protein n=1 Tax=Pyxidicoccus sp. MSG2 TaxID=2996790 RepID=UPI00226DA4E4|nr:hypothetical protein [Pyxidicoccus sp. MSG2]MCY1023332.1 hypothetical protein [Pyxidicoccus sp. MSG2]
MRSASEVEASHGGLMGLITSLAREASTAPDLRRPGMAGAINALIERLPAEAGTEETSAGLQRLLEAGALDGLMDEVGEQPSIVATRTLLNLGYPHALRVPPERLVAMRRWELWSLPVPWLALTATLFFAALLQLSFVTMGHEPGRHWPPSAEALAGQAPRPRTGLELAFRALGPEFVASGLLLANGLGWVSAVTLGRGRKARPWVRRGFAAVAALGLVLGTLQFAVDFTGAAVGAFVSAAGALTAWRMLRTP